MLEQPDQSNSPIGTGTVKSTRNKGPCSNFFYSFANDLQAFFDILSVISFNIFG